MFSNLDEKKIRFSDRISLKITRMFQRSPPTVLNLCLIFIDIDAKVTKVSLLAYRRSIFIYHPCPSMQSMTSC